jgi:hypothetical protein
MMRRDRRHCYCRFTCRMYDPYELVQWQEYVFNKIKCSVNDPFPDLCLILVSVYSISQGSQRLSSSSRSFSTTSTNDDYGFLSPPRLPLPLTPDSPTNNNPGEKRLQLHFSNIKSRNSKFVENSL